MLQKIQCKPTQMILFKVSFQNNVATTVVPSVAFKAITWKENPYTILSMDVFANNNLDALKLAQQKANIFLKKNQ